MKKELYIIRHGETELNKQGIVQGRGVNPGLNDLGRMQAANFLKKYENEGFEIIYTSSLKRTHESVAGFIEKKITWEQHAELDEISWGIFEGKAASHEFKMQYRDLLLQWQSGNLDAKATDGESPLDVQKRQQRFISYLISKPEKKVLIAMHGRAMRIFLPTLLQQDLITMDDFPHHNLTLYKVNYNWSKFSIELFNNMDHLR